jgi:hypothetical protein
MPVAQPPPAVGAAARPHLHWPKKIATGIKRRAGGSPGFLVTLMVLDFRRVRYLA